MSMHALDAKGRRVSLLNDDLSSHVAYTMPYRPAVAPSYHRSSSSRSISSSPNTPGLLRSDSYDSQMSADPVSPLTPLYDYGRGGYAASSVITSPYEDYMESMPSHAGMKRPSTFSDGSGSYDDDINAGAGADRPGKRYPCRYKESHNCLKTFTTSGHASRHSKIHTAEKAVPCSYPGCTKKFTRADNMKQHLDTHYKDKSRSSTSRPSLTSGERKSSSSSSSSKSSSSRSNTSSSRSNNSSTLSHMSSPDRSWPNFGTLELPVINGRPSTARTPSGLDALAMAVAHAQSAPGYPEAAAPGYSDETGSD
ncbi:hypothetical protein QBC34DRAFT_89900 [Podospora aff. communis PSN243]|uniref:C2H2-type domain-containing protein n=1 Tax=Podospora aff. communis PSN243 TaxID=3040156 RepID=A0AAV9GMK5_9PEZI|nr:hypothetical protein QBC34DRAFT_89900 [Podospora aff. communis PSN243]